MVSIMGESDIKSKHEISSASAYKGCRKMRNQNVSQYMLGVNGQKLTKTQDQYAKAIKAFFLNTQDIFL